MSTSDPQPPDGTPLPGADSVPGRSTPPPAAGTGASAAGPGGVGAPESRGGGNFLTRYAGLPPTGWHGISALIGIFVAFGVMIVGTIVVAIFDPSLETEAGLFAAQLVVGLGLGGTALGFALADAGGSLRDAFGRLGLGTRITLAALGLALLAWLIYILFAALLAPLLQPDQEDITRELGTDTESAISIVIAGLLIVIVAPLSEELFFRGFVFGAMRRSMSLWPAALISAVVWGSLHLSGGDIGVAIQISIFGIILAWLYERSGTLWAPVTAHLINNTIAFVVLISDSV